MRHARGTTSRLRFAPSPTGELHLGNARTAVINWLVARQAGGQLVLRMEDTDIERARPDAERMIIEDLSWLGLSWDEGPDIGGPCFPYRQSERLATYREAARRLLDAGRAYPCFCSPATLEAQRAEQLRRGEPPRYGGRCATLAVAESRARLARGERAALRARAATGTLVVRDRIKGDVLFQREHLGDFIVLRADGRPTYNFAVVVDDHAMAVTLVLRGEDHLPNTPYQLVLYEAFGWEPPAFGHVGLVVGADGAPLAKRHGAMAVGDARAAGYLPGALVAYLTSLGGGPDPHSGERVERTFALDRLRAGPVTFDPGRLRRVNRAKLARLDRVAFVEQARPFLRTRGMEVGDPRTEAALHVFREGTETLVDVADEVAAYLRWEPRLEAEEEWRKALSEPAAGLAITAARRAVAEMPELTVDGARTMLQRVADRTGLGRPVLLRTLRLALTWRERGPELPRLLALLGRDDALKRLDLVLEAAHPGSGRPA